MFQHVYNQAVKCNLLKFVCLATDDSRIFSTAEKLDVPVVMTSKEHKSGTDRVHEAARIINAADDSIIVNIQGDEPVLEPEMLDQLLGPFVSRQKVSITTLARSMNRNEASSTNLVKVVFSGTGRAMYFSRNMIPYSDEQTTCFVHIGLYAFRMGYLEKFKSLDQSRLEKIERLEQLRLLDADIPIHVVETSHVSYGVDSPEDIEKVIKIMRERNNESYSGT